MPKRKSPLDGGKVTIGDKLKSGMFEILSKSRDLGSSKEERLASFCDEAKAELAEGSTKLQKGIIESSQLLPLVADGFESYCKCCTSRFYDQIAKWIYDRLPCTEISRRLAKLGENISHNSVWKHKKYHLKNADAVKRSMFYLNTGTLDIRREVAGMIRDAEDRLRTSSDPYETKLMMSELRENIKLLHSIQSPSPSPTQVNVAVDARQPIADPTSQKALLSEIAEISSLLNDLKSGKVEKPDNADSMVRSEFRQPASLGTVAAGDKGTLPMATQPLSPHPDGLSELKPECPEAADAGNRQESDPEAAKSPDLRPEIPQKMPKSMPKREPDPDDAPDPCKLPPKLKPPRIQLTPEGLDPIADYKKKLSASFGRRGDT